MTRNMATTITLSADFSFNTILLKWEKHSKDREFNHIEETLNQNFGEIALSEDPLWLKMFDNPITNH